MFDEIKDELRGIARKIKVFKDGFLRHLDSEMVTFYQIVFYALILVNGLIAVFGTAGPALALEETLDQGYYDIWLTMNVVAPIMMFMGKWMRGKLAKAGAIFEMTGDFGFSAISWTWVVAIYYTTFGDKVPFATTYVLAGALCSGLFVVRDIRRLADKNRWVPTT